MGKKYNGLILLRDSCNSAGLMDMGVAPDYLPGYVKYSDEDGIERIGAAWGMNLKPVFTQNDLEKKIRSGEIKGVLIFGEDPLADQNNRKYFGAVEFLMVSDSFSTKTNLEADVVLPSSTFIEQEGSFTNCDHTLQKTSRITQGKNKFNNLEMINKIAGCFSDGFIYNNSDEVMREIRSVNGYYRNTAYEKSWLENPPVKFRPAGRYSFSVYDSDLTTFDYINPAIHFQENYYISNIKL